MNTINTLVDWIRTFNRDTRLGTTVNVAPVVVMAAYNAKLIKATDEPDVVKLTTKGVRSQLHDKRIMLSNDERQTLRNALQSYHLKHADKLNKDAFLALQEKLI